MKEKTRRFVAWICLLLLLSSCGRIAEEGAVAQGTATPTPTPAPKGLSVGGTIVIPRLIVPFIGPVAVLYLGFYKDALNPADPSRGNTVSPNLTKALDISTYTGRATPTEGISLAYEMTDADGLTAGSWVPTAVIYQGGRPGPPQPGDCTAAADPATALEVIEGSELRSDLAFFVCF